MTLEMTALSTWIRFLLVVTPHIFNTKGLIGLTPPTLCHPSNEPARGRSIGKLHPMNAYGPGIRGRASGPFLEEGRESTPQKDGNT